MRIWFDTEFIDDGRTIDLLSIGMVREDGEELYAEPAETDRGRMSEWLRKNVMPHLSGPIMSRKRMAQKIRRFVGSEPEFWADHAAYDWVALCQLYGPMMKIPQGWPLFCCDVRWLRAQIADPVIVLPRALGGARPHNALDDARHCRAVWQFLTERVRN